MTTRTCKYARQTSSKHATIPVNWREFYSIANKFFELKDSEQDNMQTLIDLAKKLTGEHDHLPYSVVASVKEQYILNAPVMKHLLIFVLSGVKRLGAKGEIICPGGSFIFLPNTPNIDMRNIPDKEYFALLVEFEHSDFDQFRSISFKGPPVHFKGPIDPCLEKAVQQFIEFPTYAMSSLWSARKRELLMLLYLSGYEQVSAIVERSHISHRLHDIVIEDVEANWTMSRLASRLALSEPTLRRKLKAEGVGIKTIVNRAKLGYSLHLLQTTLEPIGRIADRCGYASQSRFTLQFKALFGVTPTELRKTRFEGHSPVPETEVLISPSRSSSSPHHR